MAQQHAPIRFFTLLFHSALVAILLGTTATSGRPSVKRFHRLTRTSEPMVKAGHASYVYLTIDELRRLHFKPTVGSIRLSEGHEAMFNCSIEMPDSRHEPTINWIKNGQDLVPNSHLVNNDLQTVADGVTTLLSTIRIKQVQRADAGEYRCRLSIMNSLVESQPIIIEVEGLPTFIQQPEDINVTRNTPFTLSCEAVGPPDPVQIRWLRDGAPDSDFHNSSSSYSVSEMTKPKVKVCPSCGKANSMGQQTCGHCLVSLPLNDKLKGQQEHMRDSGWASSAKRNHNAGRALKSTQSSILKLHGLGQNPVLFFTRPTRNGHLRADLLHQFNLDAMGLELMKEMKKLYEQLLKRLDAPQLSSTPGHMPPAVSLFIPALTSSSCSKPRCFHLKEEKEASSNRMQKTQKPEGVLIREST